MDITALAWGTLYGHDPEMRLLLESNSFYIVLWSDLIFGNHGHHVLQTKEEWDLPLSVLSPKAWGFFGVYGMGSLHIWS